MPAPKRAKSKRRKPKTEQEVAPKRAVAIPMPMVLVEMRKVSTSAEEVGEAINHPLRHSLRQMLAKSPTKFCEQMERYEVEHKQRLAEAKRLAELPLDQAERKADTLPDIEDLPTEACLELIDRILGQVQ